MKEENNISDITKLLNQLPKERLENVPTNYFEELPNKLMEITDNEISIKKRSILIFGSFIGIAVVILLGIFIIKPNQKLPTESYTAFEKKFNNLTESDIETLFIYDEHEIDYTINFDDTEELQLLASTLQRPIKSIEITAEDFDDYFEYEYEEYDIE